MAKVYTPHNRSLPESYETPFPTPGFLPTSAIMISVSDPNTGIPNIMPAVGWGWLNRLPLMLGIAVNTMDLNIDYYPRGSYDLLIETMDFALNIPTEDLRDKITECGRLSRHKDPQADKFKAAGLTPGPGKNIKSPHIVECPVNYECKVRALYNMGSHDLFLGEVVGCFTDGEVVSVELDHGRDVVVMKGNDGKRIELEWRTLAIRKEV